MIVDLDFLHAIPYFSELSQQEMAEVGRWVEERRYSRGEVVFFEGDPCPGFFLVHSGRVRVFKASAEGKEQTLLIAHPGDSFNEVPIFDDGPNPATAEALEPCLLYLIPKGALLELSRTYPSIALGVMRVFARRLRQLTFLVEDLSLRPVTARVAKLLLQLAESGQEGRFTQQQLASMAGTAREMVGRAIKAMEKDGAIKVERHRVIIIRPELLREIVL